LTAPYLDAAQSPGDIATYSRSISDLIETPGVGDRLLDPSLTAAEATTTINAARTAAGMAAREAVTDGELNAARVFRQVGDEFWSRANHLNERQQLAQYGRTSTEIGAELETPGMIKPLYKNQVWFPRVLTDIAQDQITKNKMATGVLNALGIDKTSAMAGTTAREIVLGSTWFGVKLTKEDIAGGVRRLNEIARKEGKLKYDILYRLLKNPNYIYNNRDDDNDDLKDSNVGNYSYTKYSLFDYHLIMIKWHLQLDLMKYNKISNDVKDWEMAANEVNAYYHPLKNEIVFPAGILQEPFFTFLSYDELNGYGIDISNNPKYSDRLRIYKSDPKYKSLQYLTMASNFGAIGAIIGHEISHGFDDQGSEFDADGLMRQWWTDDILLNYKKIVKQLIEQYNAYEIELSIDNTINKYNVNGKLTVGENIADLFGLNIALDAFKQYYKEHFFYKTLDECLMELFISYANSWRSIEVPLKSKEKIQSDPHSPAIYRVIGVLQNMPDFYRIFNIPENKKIIKIFN
jgi:hypothetical protein